MPTPTRHLNINYSVHILAFEMSANCQDAQIAEWHGVKITNKMNGYVTPLSFRVYASDEMLFQSKLYYMRLPICSTANSPAYT